MSGLPTLDEWAAMVAPHFEFLVERDFRVVLVHDDGALAAWGPRVRYVSEQIGVELHCSLEFNRVNTSIIRLDHGHVPPYPIFIKDGDELRWLHFDGLLSVCDPGRASESRVLSGLGVAELERQLDFVAMAIRDHGDELLDPSSPVFLAWQREVHERVRADPPKMTIHVPTDVPDGEVQEFVDRSREGYPDVGVDVRRYDRSAGR